MEQDIFLIASQFATECQKLELRKGGASLSLTLTVKVKEHWNRQEGEAPKVELGAWFFDGQHGQTVIAASLGALMDEVYRRANFEDVEAMRRADVETRLVALPAPKTNVLEEPSQCTDAP